jgi:hypothetical protein
MMSGIGPKYNDLRNEILRSNPWGGEHVRGRDDGTGTVYLHKGISGFGEEAKLERERKQAQGGQNVFDALSRSVGPNVAESLFRSVGMDRGRDLKTEFKVSDFARLEELHARRTDPYRDTQPERKEPSQDEALILRENPSRTEWDSTEGKIIWK